MRAKDILISRRNFIIALGGAWATVSFSPSDLLAKERVALKRTIPSSGELLPVIGLGSSRTFDTGDNQAAQIMQTESLDFVQFTYNIDDRSTEQRLLPLAADRGMATLINRPFQRGNLFGRVKGKPLPAWAAEFDCKSWGQYFLKFVVSHPAVTCSIPATSKVHHIVDNMAAGFGRLPDAEMRNRMIRHFESV